MWRYQVNSKIFELSQIERQIDSSNDVLIELPIGKKKYKVLPDCGDEVFLVYLHNARLKGVVISKTDYSHFVLFTEKCVIPMKTSRINWQKL
jgi:hypothetical protein